MNDDALANQYLTFGLDGEVCALDIASVREVLEYAPMTRVPGLPETSRGVINVRGKAVPVVDLRIRFRLPPAEPAAHSCIVIVELARGDERLNLGALVDSVHEVMEMKPDSIQPPPRLGGRVDARLVRGVGLVGESFVTILDVERVFLDEDVCVA